MKQKIEKTTTVFSNGTGLIISIPSLICQTKDIKKGDKIKWTYIIKKDKIEIDHITK